MNYPALSAGFFNGFSFGTADTVSVGDWAIELTALGVSESPVPVNAVGEATEERLSSVF